jgi:hypothetical protein
MERPPRGWVPELGIILPPWTQAMKGLYARMGAGIIAAVIAALVLEASLSDPGPWPVIAIVACTAPATIWAIVHVARVERRRIEAGGGPLDAIRYESRETDRKRGERGL